MGKRYAQALDVPYDCGLAIVADQSVHRAAMGIDAPYLVDSLRRPDPLELGPEFSQRGREFARWAVLRSPGRRGVGELVAGLHLKRAGVGRLRRH